MTEPGRAYGTAIRVRLGPDGNVKVLERITDDEWPGLWVIRDANHNFFPVCRLDFKASDDDWSNKDRVLLGRLRRKAEELKGICASAQLVHAVTLADRFLLAAADPGRLHRALKDEGHELLHGDGARYQLAFDVDTETVYRTATKDAVVEAFLLSESGAPGHLAQTCAYSGTTASLQTKPFPKVKLPVLNKEFPLVSMFSEAPCNRRYGLADSSIVPVATNVALEMQNALAFIVADEREGLTWRGIWNGHFETAGGHQREQRDLLIAYVEGGVILLAQVASIFGSGTDDDAKQFEADASAVCDALDGVAREAPASRLNLFLLRAVSEGQMQLQLSVRPAVSAVLDAARSWQEGAKNLPEVAVPVPNKIGGYSLHRPRAAHPDRLVSLTSREWMESGRRWSPSRGASFNQVVNVMLKGAGWADTATDLLALTLRRTWPLMIGLFGAILRMGPENSARHGYTWGSCHSALRAISALGILLYVLGHRKEDYMHTAPFLVGRLLALADVLHREHSRHERDAGPPPQMIGNALMAVARDNPTAAVARLNERLPFYIAWAQKSDDRLAKWAVNRMQTTATRLMVAPLPTNTSEADRAQLLLGYISRLSDCDSAEEASTEETDEESEGGNND